jgi:hypothetical protein
MLINELTFYELKRIHHARLSETVATWQDQYMVAFNWEDARFVAAQFIGSQLKFSVAE